MSSQGERELREWLARGYAGSPQPDQAGPAWREGRRRRRLRVLGTGTAVTGLVAAAGATVFALGGGPVPPSGDLGPAGTGTESAPVDPTPEPTPSPSAEPAPAPTEQPATKEPTTEPTTEEPAGECSSSAYSEGRLSAEGVPPEAADTALTLLQAAVTCDEDTLVTMATQDETSPSFGGRSAEEVLALPDAEERYLVLAVLLTETEPTTIDSGVVTFYAWPEAHGPGGPTEEQWEDLVDAGLYTQEEVDLLRQMDGYLGWRVGIAEDGRWQFFIAGD